MKSFLVVYVVMQIIALIVRLGLLAFAEYPRTVETNRATDVFTLILTGGFLVWASLLLNSL
jgi:hypothetical protein